jgi:hypothetical protein
VVKRNRFGELGKDYGSLVEIPFMKAPTHYQVASLFVEACGGRAPQVTML